MTPVRLSICMPTYNFGVFIGETLESIIPQLEPAMEVVILDGGSTDNTQEAVQAYARACPQITYVRQPYRGGIDRDMARCVELARGEYCWLFSSDDIMRPGAVRRVAGEIESALDIYLCGLTLCDRQMRVLHEHPVLDAPAGDTFELHDAGQRLRYFAAAQTTTALFSFMGSLIFRRSRWQQHALEESYVGSCWAHVLRILRMIPDGLKVKYLADSLLFKRSDNDSFMDRGLVHRYSIAIDGYHRLARDIFGEDSVEARHIRRVITNEYPLSVMFFTRVQCRDERRYGDIAELDRLVKLTYRDPTMRNLLRRIAYHPVFDVAYEAVRRLYKAMRRRGWVPARK